MLSLAVKSKKLYFEELPWQPRIKFTHVQSKIFQKINYNMNKYYKEVKKIYKMNIFYTIMNYKK